MKKQHKVASVVLNYNSSVDVQVILPHLIKQRGIDHCIIVIDNASCPEDVGRLREIFLKNIPEGVITQEKQVLGDLAEGPSAFLVLNGENKGYSAGNNVGIRLAERLGADAVLIANPDMRIENASYIEQLADDLFSSEKNLIAASRILGVDGTDQNPQKENSFWQELLWPAQYLGRLFGPTKNHLLSELASSDQPIAVSKVSGCCLMLRMTFMQETEYLDESVFLYCEEPILAARVKSAGGQIIYVPKLSAVHAHYKDEKGDQVKRTKVFLRSRRYFNKNYGEYKKIQLIALDISYGILLLFRRFIKLIRQ